MFSFRMYVSLLFSLYLRRLYLLHLRPFIFISYIFSSLSPELRTGIDLDGIVLHQNTSLVVGRAATIQICHLYHSEELNLLDESINNINSIRSAIDSNNICK